MASRIDAVRTLVGEADLDAILLTSLPDIRWASGFTGSNGILLIGREEAHFVTDGRYTEQASEEVEGAQVHTPGYRLYDYVEEKSLLDGVERAGFQSDDLSVDQATSLKQRFDEIQWNGCSELLVRHRAEKDESEVEAMRKAQTITDRVFDEILALVRPGVTERELAAEIVYRHLKYGVERMAFDPIVASGTHGAKPHAKPTDRALERGDLVVMDFGGVVDGYASDMTRTVGVGALDTREREVYDVVLRAQKAALEEARAGMSSKSLDAVAREVVEEAGFGEAFSHGLGHGLGLEVHEWPRLSQHVDEELPENCVVSIEPGVYLADEFGVRIEDIVVLRPDGADVLTGARKELIVA